MKFSCVIFYDYAKDKWNTVDVLYIRKLKVFVCKIFATLCYVYVGFTPIPYVQDTIL